MDTLHPICAGLDVHKDTVVACVRWLDNRQRPQRGVAHSMLVMCCPILKKGEPYRELGADHLAGLAPERRTQPLVRQLESLGHKVTLEPKAVASAQGYFHGRL